MQIAGSKWKWLLYMAPFVAVSLFAFIHHEPHRDESQDFLAVCAGSWKEIYIFVVYHSASGPLLYILTTLLACISKQYIGLAIFSWLITFGSVALVCSRSRFRPYEKILLSLGYFFVYDYAIYWGRPYGLTVLLFFAALSFYSLRYERPRLVVLLAALPSLASIPGVLISGLMLGLLGWDFLRKKRNLLNLLVALPVLLLTIYVLMPPLNSPEKRLFMMPAWPDPTITYYTIKGVINRIFLTVTGPDMYYFPHVAVDHPHYSLLLALVFIALTFIVAPRRLLPMVFFWTAAAVFMGVFILRPGSGIRHQGFLMMILLGSVWLERLYEPDKQLFTVRYLHHPTTVKLAFVAILALQVWSGLNAVYIDYKYPNSLGTEAAKFLREDMAATPPERTLIATFNSSQTLSILILMPQPVKFYSIEMQRPYRYFAASYEWLSVEPNGNKDKYNLQVIMQRFLKEVQTGKYDRVYLVLPFPIDVRFNNAVLRLVYMPSTYKLITMDEIFFIYRLDKDKAAYGRNKTGPGCASEPNWQLGPC